MHIHIPIHMYIHGHALIHASTCKYTRMCMWRARVHLRRYLCIYMCAYIYIYTIYIYIYMVLMYLFMRIHTCIPRRRETFYMHVRAHTGFDMRLYTSAVAPKQDPGPLPKTKIWDWKGPCHHFSPRSSPAPQRNRATKGARQCKGGRVSLLKAPSM